MRLTGWQRIGIIASVAWLPAGFLGYQAFANAQLATARTQYAACVTRVTQAVQELKDKVENEPPAPSGEFTDAQVELAEDPYDSETFKCGRIYQLATAEISSRKRQLAVAAALLPIFLMWTFVWLFVKLCRWVRAGFHLPSESLISDQEKDSKSSESSAGEPRVWMSTSIVKLPIGAEDLHGNSKMQIDAATRAAQEQTPSSPSDESAKTDHRSTFAKMAIIPAAVAAFAAKQWSSFFVANVSSPGLAALVTGASVLFAATIVYAFSTAIINEIEARYSESHFSPKGKATIYIVMTSFILFIAAGFAGNKSHSPSSQQATNSNVRAVVKDIRQVMFPANAASISVGNREQRVREFVNSPTVATSQVGQEERDEKEFAAEVLALRDKLSNVGDRINWGSLLDPSRIANDKNMAQSAVMVNTMRNATNIYVVRMREAINNLPPNLKIAMPRKQRDLMLESLALQQQVIDRAGEVIAFLTKTYGRWSVRQQRIMFERPQDADQFNQYLHQAYATDDKRQSVEKERLDLAKADFKKRMKELDK